MTRQAHHFVRKPESPPWRRLVASGLACATLATFAPATAFADGSSGRSPAKQTAVSVSFGVAVVGLVVAGASGALMLAKRGELEDECGSIDACPASSQDDVDRYHTYGTVSAVALGASAVGAITGFSLILIGDEEEPKKASANVQASVSPRFVGVKGRF